ncbi:hypothetical protein IIY68_02665 [Candidatus Saccharibacteria bacterium]|nr:hypothetical protein [Candidatus Saccharibacteria bacterium]
MGSKQYKTNNYTDFFYKTFRNILLVSIPLIIVLGLFLSSLHSSASTDQIEFSLSVSCTMSSIVNTAHTKEITNGTYHSDIGKTTITALCNDGNGYTVYATGYSNNEVGNNKLINTTNSQYSIDTGLATSGLTSQWAMKLNNLENDPSSTPPIIESAYDDTYGLVPNNWTKVASRPSGTTDMNLGSSFTTTYSIYTSSSQFAGTYRGQVKYALLHPYSNANTPSFDNFDQAFAFYEKTKVTVTDPITGETGSYYKMQDMEGGICDNVSSAGESTAIQLVDIRDNKLYWIAKLADNHCWMTQNLELDLDSTAVAGSANALTSENTNLKTYGSNGYDSDNGYSCSNTQTTTNCTASGEVITWIPARTTVTELTTGENSNFPNTTEANSTPYSYNPGDSYYYPSVSGDDIPYNLTECESQDHTDCVHYKAGNYYNWSASVASNNTSSYASNNTDAGNSVCPKGWRLPKKTASEFQNLINAYSITSANALNLRNSPLYFVRSGRVYGGSLNNTAPDGYYRSSTVSDISSAYSLGFDAGYLNPARNYDRYLGQSIRCLAE